MPPKTPPAPQAVQPGELVISELMIAPLGVAEVNGEWFELANISDHDIKLAEGCIYLLPANVPHAPMRGPDTVGLIIERIRKGDLLDTHRWYCEKCNNVLFEKTVKIEVLERDMPPVFEAYYGDPENQHCKKCGNINPGRPAKK